MVAPRYSREPESRTARSVLGGTLDVVDDDDLHISRAWHKSQSKIIFQSEHEVGGIR